MNISKKKNILKRKKQINRNKNYISNDEFYEEIIAYKNLVNNCKNIDYKIPIPDRLGLFFIKLAKNLATKKNFINYTFKDEMIADGVENCIKYINNFDPNKSKNPFSYFTQFIFYAFIRRIKKEKKQLYIKYKSFIESELSDNEEILNILQKKDSLLTNKLEFISNFEKSVNVFKNKNKNKKKTCKIKKYYKRFNTFFDLFLKYNLNF